MKEPVTNLRIVHSSCAPKPDKKLAKKPGNFFIGKYVKTSFPTLNNASEHMWVKVTAFKGGKLHGVLNNDPILPMKLKCGDPVTVSLDDLEAYE